MERLVARARIKTRFDRWDRARSGELTRADLMREAERIATAFGVAASDEPAVRLRDALLGLFELCAHHAGVSRKGPITETQFRKVAEDLIFEQGEAAFNRALRPVVDGVIGLCDHDGDRRIDRAEFHRWLCALGLDERLATAAFERVDVEGRGTLSDDEVLAAIRDYHYGRLDMELIAG